MRHSSNPAMGTSSKFEPTLLTSSTTSCARCYGHVLAHAPEDPVRVELRALRVPSRRSTITERSAPPVAEHDEGMVLKEGRQAGPDGRLAVFRLALAAMLSGVRA